MPRFDAPFFLLRTPLLPVEDLKTFFQIIDDAPVRTAFIKKIYSREIILESLYLASPLLYKQTLKYLNDTLTSVKDFRKIENSLIEYYIRMTGRSTPFGLFAGCSLGYFSDETKIELEDHDQFIRHVRLDMDFLFTVYKRLLAEPTVLQSLSYKLNNSLYKLGNEVRYIEYLYKDGKRKHNLVKIPYDSVISRITKEARNYIPFGKLVEVITSMGYDEEDARGYITSLVENQFLKSELEPNVTGEEYNTILIRNLLKIAATHPLVQSLLASEEYLKQVNPETPGDNIRTYLAMTDKFKSLQNEMDEGKLLQMDLYKPTKVCHLNKEIKEGMLEVMSALHKLNTVDGRDSQLDKFKKAFFERYEYQPVRLIEALDNEIGLGYKTAKSTAEHYNKNNFIYTASMDLKLEKYYEALTLGKQTIDISDADLKRLPEPVKPIPSSMGALGNVVKIGGKEMITIKTIAGPSGANLLGRFCHSSSQMEKEVMQICQQEESLDEDSIFAEIVHLPESRIGNILTRPLLRNYEIAYLCNSILPEENILAIDDLYLVMPSPDVMVLFSKSLKKRVYPRLSTAHNFMNPNLPIYNFLSEYQFDKMQYFLRWDWGLLEPRPFLPRVTYKNSILSSARWSIVAEQIRDILKQNGDKKFEMFREYLGKLNIPGIVALQFGENEFVMDLGKVYFQEALLKYVERYQRITLKEYYFNDGEMVVTSKAGHHANEVVIPFVQTEVPDKLPAFTLKNWDQLGKKAPRKLYPGSEWIYFKLYISSQLGDSLLQGPVRSFIKELRSKKLISNAFFIRYADPHFHIRVRIRMEKNEHISQVFSLFHKFHSKMLAAGTVHKVVVDTYEREIERYGQDSMMESEDLFNANSIAALDFLHKTKDIPDNYQLKLYFGLAVSIHYIHFIMGDMENRKGFVDYGYEMYAKEFGVAKSKYTKQELSDLYRHHGRQISMLETNSFNHPVLQQLVDKHIKETDRILAAIKIKRFKKPDMESVRLLISHIHMFYNRLFSKNQRREELRLYYLLSNYYKSIMARTSITGKQKLKEEV
jgi:thiopeptide-type bacteriocin biosynthesis protein